MDRDEVCSSETFKLEYYADAVSRLYKALGYISRGEADLEDISRRIDLTHYATEALTGLSTSRTLKRHEKKSCCSYLGHLKSIGRILNESLKRGGSLEQLEESVAWDINDTASESRLETAIITNLNHLDIQTFMQDASKIFVEQVKMDLASLNHLAANGGFPPTVKLDELVPGKRYRISDMGKMNTRYGSRVIADIDETTQVFLPKRIGELICNDDSLFTNMTQSISRNELYLKYLGDSNVEFTSQ
ncbi:hypothetical protein QAD02_007870 [Eretmocerus hayati]|uniref:Uncharacterized protein n=1 Tax=Eretmocerus hayati TaxID=131215 RepID=A0ACC2N5I1_9HYME|nr:hypothetical protein QAD02_007870 [Eretmocerus hayati]